MKELPNGMKVFNATSKVIRFDWLGWPEPVEVEPDAVVDVRIREHPDFGAAVDMRAFQVCGFVRIEFVSTEEGREVVRQAYADGADIVVGSRDAARAYPGVVAVMPDADGTANACRFITC